MARYVFEEQTRVWWVTTLSSLSSPTATQINAGTDITAFVSKDGIKMPINQNMVDNATIAESFDSELVGSWGGGGAELTMFRDATPASDTAWNLCIRGTNGYLIIRYGVAVATAATAAQKVEVWPAQMHQPVNTQSARNEQVRFTEKFAITSQPSLSATVA